MALAKQINVRAACPKFKLFSSLLRLQFFIFICNVHVCENDFAREYCVCSDELRLVFQGWLCIINNLCC